MELDEFIVNNLYVKRNSISNPESYEISRNDKIVGDIKLQYGVLLCCLVDGTVVYNHKFYDSSQGIFDNDIQRQRYLVECLDCLTDKLNFID